MKRVTQIISSFILLLIIVSLPWKSYAGNPPDQSKSSITGTYAPADGTTSSSVTIALRDSSGTSLTASDWILITSSDSTTSFSPSSATLDGSGVLYTKMKSSHVGYVPVTVNDTTTNTLISGSIYFYTPGGIPPSSGSCLDLPPGSTVQLTSATSAGDTSVTLTWAGASNPVTYYLVSYGVAAGNYIYGNPNVGGQGTTSYTVGGLTKGSTYYFAVRAGNGCTPGAYSNELSAIAGGAAVSTITPTTTPVATLSATPRPTSTLTTTPIATVLPSRAPSVTPKVTQVPDTPVPIVTPVAGPVSDNTSQVKIIVLVSTIIGVLLLIGTGVWIISERKKSNEKPPVIEY